MKTIIYKTQRSNKSGFNLFPDPDTQFDLSENRVVLKRTELELKREG